MSVTYKFNKARQIIRRMNETDLADMRNICLDIQSAQEELLRASKGIMNKCIHRCEGLCCRNVVIDEIIGLWDFVYILTLDQSIYDTASLCLENETILYSSDCIFLKDGVGPCIFPPNIRPEVCITSFCDDTAEISKEIKRVKSGFIRLGMFVKLEKPRAVKRKISKILNKA